MRHLFLASCFALATSNGVAAQGLDGTVTRLRAEAQMHENGEGVVKDPLRAVELYCQASRLGDPLSQYALGWMYANGRGVSRNDALASALFALSAEQGNVQARALLAFTGPPAAELPMCMSNLVPLLEIVEEPIVVAEETKKSEERQSPEYDAPEFVPTNDVQRKLAEIVRAIAPEYNVSPALALAIIRAESNFDATARSPKNAQGLMQLIPETSARFNVKKPYDPVQNIRGGLAYLRWLLAYFRGNVPLVAAAYNAGEGAVDRHRGVPPYMETREYVRRIMGIFRRADHPFDPSVTDPSPALGRMSTQSPK